MYPFTVIGFYEDTRQRFSDTFYARDAEHAEDYAETCHKGLVVCGVITGEVEMADKTRSSIDE